MPLRALLATAVYQFLWVFLTLFMLDWFVFEGDPLSNLAIAAKFTIGFAVLAAVTLARACSSVSWRWSLLRHHLGSHHRDPKFVLNEDGNIVPPDLLPFEKACVTGSFGADGEPRPSFAHIHTRTLVRGRPVLRGETEWSWPE